MNICVTTLAITALGFSLSLVDVAVAKPALQKDKPWEFLLLSQFWPPTSCYVFFKKNCTEIPKEVTEFTIHGLWPSVPGPKQPFYCNDTAHFDYSKIETLGDQLDARWHDYEGGSRTGLWDHEWGKHGTCAETLPILRGEFNYFNVTLALQKPLHVLERISKHGIVPSKEPYAAQDVCNALYAEFGKIPGIGCLRKEDGKDATYYLEEVHLCYDKLLRPIDCVESAQLKRGFPVERASSSDMNCLYVECPSKYEKALHFIPMERPDSPTEKVMYFKSEVDMEVVEWEN